MRQLQQGFATSEMRLNRHFAWQQSSGPNVRFGSKADILRGFAMSSLPQKRTSVWSVRMWVPRLFYCGQVQSCQWKVQGTRVMSGAARATRSSASSGISNVRISSSLSATPLTLLFMARQSIKSCTFGTSESVAPDGGFGGWGIRGHWRDRITQPRRTNQ